jgi:hypothetical protein
MEGKIILDAIMGVYLSTLNYILSEGMYQNKTDTKRGKGQNEEKCFDN